MNLAALVDRLLPGPDSPLDRSSLAAQAAISRAADTPAGRNVHTALHGNAWLGHPAHPIVITVPIGAWATAAWFDARSAATGQRRYDAAADGALRVGIGGALLAAVTGAAQFLDTRGGVRRETTVHAALNNAALALYVASWAARRAERRPLGRRLAALGLGVVGVSGYLGGDLSYRHGVGMRPQALRDPALEAPASSDTPIEASGSLHV